jgi:transcriptional regulator with AAA-type ATPase domain
MSNVGHSRVRQHILLPFAKCDRLETELLVRSLTHRFVNFVVLGETGTGKSRLIEEIHKKWTERVQLKPEEVRRREGNREGLLSILLDKRKYDTKYRGSIDEYRGRIGDLKRLGIQPTSINLVDTKEDVAASELFGTIPGAFTQVEFRLGRIAEAHESMLFIDELGYVPKQVQAKLLTTIQERRFIPIGGSKLHEIEGLNVRYVAALTPPYDAVLPELFYRLGWFVIELRPLNDIKREVPDLFEQLVHQCLHESDGANYQNEQRAGQSMSRGAMAMLRRSHWPGNVRQLENVVRRASLLAADPKGSIGEGDVETALKFDPANYLTIADDESRLAALFRERVADNTPFSSERVNYVLAKTFVDGVGFSRAMDLLGVRDHALRTMLGKPPRVRRPKVGKTAESK